MPALQPEESGEWPHSSVREGRRQRAAGTTAGPAECTVAEYLLRWLRSVGIEHLFLVPGSHLDPLFRRLTAADSPVKPVIAAHELAAGYMADGYGRCRGGLGAVAAIGGPGTHNLSTAVLTASADQRPLLVISGDAPASLGAWPTFQNGGRQGSNDLQCLSSLTRWSARLDKPRQLPRLLAQAWAHAVKPPRGPVHLQVPSDFFDAELFAGGVTPLPRLPEAPRTAVRTVRDLLASERRLLVYAGSGIVGDESQRQLARILAAMEVPLVTTIGQQGILPDSSPLNWGCLGFAGHYKARALALSDTVETILFMGVDLTDRNTLDWDTALLARRRRLVVVHPTCNAAVLGAHPWLEWIAADPDSVVRQLAGDMPAAAPHVIAARRRWARTMAEFADERPTEVWQGDWSALDVDAFLRELRAAMPEDTLLFVDSGLAKSHAVQSWRVDRPGVFLLSPQGGSMGWGLSAAIGASFAAPGRRVLAIAGDGCMQMHGMELATAARYDLPVTFLVLNNHSLGTVALRMKGHPGALDALRVPAIDWQGFAGALGVAGYRLKALSEWAAMRDEYFRRRGPVLIELMAALSPPPLLAGAQGAARPATRC